MRDRGLDPWLLLDEDTVEFEQPVHRQKKDLRSQRKTGEAKASGEAARPEDDPDALNFTFTASRHERVWIEAALAGFYHDHLITDVLHQVKGGKEANVYCCRAHPALGGGLLAAKIYRPRMFRNLKNDALYRAGRQVLDDNGKPVRDQRSQRALAKKTRFGSEIGITSWIEHEYQALHKLHAAGGSVPRPVAQQGNAILMAYLGEAHRPAPTLNDVSLDPQEAQPLFDLLIDNIRLMLALDCIHADLSAYNVLYWEGQISIIDFPQVIDPLDNPKADKLLSRDVERICQYFNRFGVDAHPQKIANDLWSAYQRRELAGPF